VSEEGLEKSAILLLSLGEEEASEVLKYLGPKEVQKLGSAMAALGTINHGKVASVLHDFRQEAESKAGLGGDTDAYLRSVLTKALGDDKAGALLERILQGGDNSGIESLKWMDANSIAELIRQEHPQIVATILVHLDRDHAADILKLFPDRLRNDIMLRIATLEGAQPVAMKELNDVLAKILTGGEAVKKTSLGGVRTTAEILNYMGGAMETSVLDAVKDYDAELAQRIQDQMFTFDNLLDLDDKAVQLLLREVQSESLIIALKGTSAELREKIFKNMSSRAAEMLKEDLEAKGPVRLSEVEAEQKEILKSVRKLADAGQIVIGGRGAEEGMVE
jgi:flagellar motor switch protein FliG